MIKMLYMNITDFYRSMAADSIHLSVAGLLTYKLYNRERLIGKKLVTY